MYAVFTVRIPHHKSLHKPFELCFMEPVHCFATDKWEQRQCSTIIFVRTFHISEHPHFVECWIWRIIPQGICKSTVHLASVQQTSLLLPNTLVFAFQYNVILCCLWYVFCCHSLWKHDAVEHIQCLVIQTSICCWLVTKAGSRKRARFWWFCLLVS